MPIFAYFYSLDRYREREVTLRVGENEVVFKSPLTPIRSSYSQDTMLCINHTIHNVFVSLQETKSSQKESTKKSKEKGKTFSPKLK